MSATTIEVPATEVEAIRASLVGRRNEGSQRVEVDRLLSEIAGAAAGPCMLTGSRQVIWSAVYDSLCQGAEHFADTCNDLWRDDADADVARSDLADLNRRLDLLLSLGVPLGDG